MIMMIVCLSFMFNNSIAGADNGNNIYITRPNFVAAATQPLLKEAIEKITFGGLVKIRLVGTTMAIWTLKEAIGL